MLPRGALLGGVAIAVVAFYCKLWNVQFFKEEAVLLQQLHANNQQATEPVVLALGRGFFVIATAAWVVLSLQSIIAGIQRARYKLKVQRPLQPLSEEEARQQQQPQQPAAAGPSSAPTSQPASRARAAAAAAAAAAAEQQQQQAQDWRDQARLRALEAAQRTLDEQAAALRQQQEAEQAARRQRKAQAAEEAAHQAAAKQAAEAAARAETAARAEAAAREAAERRALFNQAVRDQWLGVEPPRPVWAAEAGPGAADADLHADLYGDSTTAGAGAGAGTAAAAATGAGGGAAGSSAQAARQGRDLRQQQDWEYQQSLEADRAKTAAKAAQRQAAQAALQAQAQQQRLAALRQSLQHSLAPEPPVDASTSAAAAAACGGEEDGGGSEGLLTLRVRLPQGGQASRRFRPRQGFDEVFAWVYSLPQMPLWPPGSWTLISSFPRRQLAPPSSSSWAPGAWERQQQGVGVGTEGAAGSSEELLLPGEWMLRVNQWSGASLWVKVHEESSMQEVMAEVEAQTGVAVDLQRFIFSGQVLHFPQRTLKQLSISPGHTLLLSVRHSAAGSSSGGSDGSAGGAAGSGRGRGGGESSQAEAAGRAQELAKAPEQAYLGGGECTSVVVSTVAELQEQVAHGAALLALYVEALQPQ